MTNIAASIGVAQLKKIDKILIKKQKILNWYKKNLIARPIKFQKVETGNTSSNWLVTIILGQEYRAKNLMDYLQSSNIDSRPLFYPIHKMPPYFLNRTLPNSETLSNRVYHCLVIIS